MVLDRTSGVSLHLQIASHFRERMARGDLLPGSRLPAERTLAASLGVNRSTVRAAYGLLRADGALEGRTRAGTLVAPRDEAAPDWKLRLDVGRFFPDSTFRQEVLEGVRTPGILPLATVAPPLEGAPDLTAIPLGLRPKGGMDPRDRYGYAPLRETLAQRMGREGIPAQPDGLLLLESPEEALSLAVQCLLEGGDNVVTQAPSARFSLDLFPSAGVRLFGVPSDRDGLRTAELADFLDRRRVRLIVSSPTCPNPTGRSLTLERRRALLDLASRHRAPVLEDARMAELWFDREAPPPSLRELDTGAHVLHIASVSGSLGPLVRTAWVAGPKPVIDRMAEAKWQMGGGAGLLSQAILHAWLASGCHEAHLERTRFELRRRLEAMEEALHRELGPLAAWERPEGGLHLWCQFDVADSSLGLFRRALGEGVAAVPGGFFGREPKGLPRLRLSFAALAPTQIREAVRRLGRAVRMSRG